MPEQLELFEDMIIEIDRDLGPGFITYTGRPDHREIINRFMDRFGFEPEQIIEERQYTFVGPAPDRDWDLDYLED